MATFKLLFNTKFLFGLISCFFLNKLTCVKSDFRAETKCLLIKKPTVLNIPINFSLLGNKSGLILVSPKRLDKKWLVNSVGVVNTHKSLQQS